MGSMMSLVEPVSLKLCSHWKPGEDMHYWMTLFGVEPVAFFSLPFTSPWPELRLSLSAIIGS